MVDELADDFKSTLAAFCKEQQRNQPTVREYEMSWSPTRDDLQYVSLNEHEGLRQQVNGALNPEDLPSFTNDKRVTDRLRFYAITAQLEDGKVLAGFRWLTPTQKPDLGKSRFPAIRNQQHGRYERLVNELMVFDDKIDCLVYKDIVFISNKGKFEQIFNFDKVIRDAAEAALSRIRQNLSIRNLDEFEAACRNNIDKQKRLDAVRGKVNLSALTVESAQSVINENSELGSILSTDEQGNTSLTYDPANQWDLLNFLSLSTNRSVATGQIVESRQHRVL